MRKRAVYWSLSAIVALGLAGFGLWLVSLPPAAAPREMPPLPVAEARATLAALAPAPGRRPVIAILGLNDATETTDYLMPYGILKRADVAEVTALATEPGPVELYPALTVEPDETLASFDTRHPGGADYVLVPAMSRRDDPAVLSWLRQQAKKGAIVIGICAGALVVAEAGLLEGRAATTHWFYRDELRETEPSVRYVPDRRLVVDGRVATTTGVSASMPMALTLIEAIAGRDRAEAVAHAIGLAGWDARHDSAAFDFTRPFATTVLVNVLSFWNRETLDIALQPDTDGVSLALVADAWSRTYRSQARTVSGSPDAVPTRHGLAVIPDGEAGGGEGRTLPTIGDRPPAEALDDALQAIAARHGDRTADVVAMQIEYRRPE